MAQKLINNPDDLIAQLVEGMVSAHPRHLTVTGKTGRAIVALQGPRAGKVGIVVGGGSGHEPAFAGYVGKGLADAAVLGNVFASPSPTQIMDAAYAADGGAGVLFLYGNYTGDVMNFTMAAEALVDQGILARSFVITDDIASAAVDRMHERRGIAGNFFVFKIAGAAADQGATLEQVEAAARAANAATRTMGVALSACSMPQTGRANFEVPDGEMEIGMGIHGEPGIARVAVQTADAVVDRLLEPILAELAVQRGDRVAVLVNGLGATTLMELYLLHRRVAQILAARGVQIHQSWVGEYCTALEMAGASVTILRLDGALTGWLDHACDTPALRVGAVVAPPALARSVAPQKRRVAQVQGAEVRGDLIATGKLTPVLFRAMMAAAAQAIYAERDALCALDGALGDGDHGVTMEIGWKAAMRAVSAAAPDATISGLCEAIAEAFLDAVGASAGPLYASGFKAAARAVSDRQNLDAAGVAVWLAGMAEGIMARGGAGLGDKTMVDAWLPAARAAVGQGSEASALQAAAGAAARGAEATAPMQSNLGRSKKLGARSVGHIDPGAASAAIMLGAWAEVLGEV